MDYVNLNNTIYVRICEAHDGLIQVENKILEMKIKQEITVPPLRDLIFDWLDKQLVVVSQTT